MENIILKVEEVIIPTTIIGSSSSSSSSSSRPSNLVRPMEALNELGTPPFLTKTFEMVEDPKTDEIVSWSNARNSFVVWDSHKFSTLILPTLFKHNNFSSFVRQLNTYGFRKVDPDRWEFANEGFLGGQKHLLKTIKRRRNVAAQSFQHQGGSCVEVGHFGLDGEIDRLKRDRTMLMTEIVKLRQQQQSSKQQLVAMETRLHSTEKKQQQTMTFLAKALVNPTFVQNLMQQSEQRRNSVKGIQIGMKRRLAANPNPIVDDLTGFPELIETTSIGSYPVPEPGGLATIGSDIETLFSAALDDGSSIDFKEQNVNVNVDDLAPSGNGRNNGNVDDMNWEEFLWARGEDSFQGDQQEVEVPVEDFEPETGNWGEDLQDLIDQLGLDSQR